MGDRHIGRETEAAEGGTINRVVRGIDDALVVSQFPLDRAGVEVSPPVIDFNGALWFANNVYIVAVRYHQKVRIFTPRHLEAGMDRETEEERTETTALT